MIFSPFDVENNKDLEGIFIRKNKRICEEIEKLQKRKGLYMYKKGNVLMVHLDFSRTIHKFMKVRRKFNALAIFERYVHGNVQCKVYKSGK
jgi:hypothetical protein